MPTSPCPRGLHLRERCRLQGYFTSGCNSSYWLLESNFSRRAGAGGVYNTPSSTGLGVGRASILLQVGVGDQQIWGDLEGAFGAHMALKRYVVKLYAGVTMGQVQQRRDHSS